MLPRAAECLNSVFKHTNTVSSYLIFKEDCFVIPCKHWSSTELQLSVWTNSAYFNCDHVWSNERFGALVSTIFLGLAPLHETWDSAASPSADHKTAIRGWFLRFDDSWKDICKHKASHCSCDTEVRCKYWLKQRCFCTRISQPASPACQWLYGEHGGLHKRWITSSLHMTGGIRPPPRVEAVEAVPIAHEGAAAN